MFEKDAFFYMANLHPELGRMLDADAAGKRGATNTARIRARRIIEKILSFETLPPAAREEWYALSNLLDGYDVLGTFEKEILKNYAEPFALKYMRSLLHLREE